MSLADPLEGEGAKYGGDLASGGRAWTGRRYIQRPQCIRDLRHWLEPGDSVSYRRQYADVSDA